MKIIYKTAGVLFTILSIVYFSYFLIKHFEISIIQHWDLHVFELFLLCLILYLLVLITGTLVWISFINSMGEHIGFIKGSVIFFLSQFAKYIPGNIGHHVGRVALSKIYGLNIQKVILCIFFEAGWLIVSASFIAIISIIIAGHSVFQFIPNIPSLWQIFAIAIVAGTLPILIVWGNNNIFPESVKKIFGKINFDAPDKTVLFYCFLLYVLGFLFMGLVMDLIATGMFYADERHFWLLTGVFSVAWVTGFITPGAPAGLGVREAILIAVLTLVYDSSIALGISVMLRLISVIGDGIAFVVGLGMKKWLIDQKISNCKV